MLGVLHAAHQGVSGMTNRAEQSVFWPGITKDILRIRSTCRTCVRNAPSQPAGLPVAPPSPSYPFEMMAADYFHLDGWNYLVLGDRYSGWISIHKTGRGEYDTERLIEALKEHFVTFNVASEIATDGGPQFKSSKFEKFLQQYGVHHRLSSSYYAHSNMRAELAVKSGKRLLRDNVGPNGELGTDRFLRAMMQYRNTPHPDTRLSPAQVVFGRQIRDFLPVVGHKYEPKQEWGLVQEARDKALARRLDRDGARLEQYTKKQRMIPVGDSVAVQNQTGRYPKKWDKTGVVVENMDHDKVRVRLDGSRKLTTRNRQFVKKIVSPPDLPCQGSPDFPISSMDDGLGLSTPVNGTVKVDEGEDELQQDQAAHDGAGMDLCGDENVDMMTEVADDDQNKNIPAAPVMSNSPIINRPRREKKPNIKYSSAEYDLSALSAGEQKVWLFGLHIRKPEINASELEYRMKDKWMERS